MWLIKLVYTSQERFAGGDELKKLGDYAGLFPPAVKASDFSTTWDRNRRILLSLRRWDAWCEEPPTAMLVGLSVVSTNHSRPGTSDPGLPPHTVQRRR